MRSDLVFSLSGDILTLADAKAKVPALRLALMDATQVVIRVVVGEPLTLQEADESIETFPGEITLSSGRLVITTEYDGSDEDDDSSDSDRVEVKLPKGPYRFTLHGTIAGPTTPAKIEKEFVAKYFQRTRPGQAKPSWLDLETESEEFWVGLILHLEPIQQPVSQPAKVKKIHPGKSVHKPPVCPPGLLSERPQGYENFIQTDLNYIHDIPKMVSKLVPVKLEAGPVSLPVTDLILPYWIAWICGETHPWVKITCDPTFQPAWPGFREGIKATRLADGWRVDIEGSNARFSQFGHLRQVAGLLDSLPTGSTIELATASDDGEGKKGRQRYLGLVKHGRWVIDATYPAMNAADLQDMLDLVRQAERGIEVVAQDDAEAERIEKAIRTKDFLLSNNPPVRSQRTFRLAPEQSELMPFLVARAFIARHPKVLPMIDRDDGLADWDNIDNLIAQAGAQFATGTVIFEGRFAKFTQTDLATLPEADHAFAESCDQELRKLGFQFLGDLHSTQTFQALFRGYALPGAPIYGAIIDACQGSPNQDFYTRFADGFSLTTTNGEGAKPRLQTDKSTKSYNALVPGTMTDRWKSHLERLATLSEKHGPPVAAGKLPDFARELDDFFCRQHGIEVAK